MKKLIALAAIAAALAAADLKWGIRCVLVRDLTDAMYNPKMRPYVSHEKGTELVIRHIERYWCPTVTSAQLMRAIDAAR